MYQENLKVSVNIPIYNASKYLRKCLDSMRNQTLREIEFILIDDGSTDNSLQICNEYAAIDKRFKVFHKSNGGSASARQLALDKSVGEYVIVCDADDWAEPNMYERLYDKAKSYDADLSICDYFVNYDNGKQIELSCAITTESSEQLLRDVLLQSVPPASWVKLIRRSFLTENNIYYEKGINLGEDYLILIKIVQCNPKIIKIDKPLYHYRRVMSGTSYTNAPKYESFQQMESVYMWVRDNVDIVKFRKEIFYLGRDVGYLGIRIPNMNISHYQKFLKEELAIFDFLKFKALDLKSLIVILSKWNRNASVMLYGLLSHYFYK